MYYTSGRYMRSLAFYFWNIYYYALYQSEREYPEKKRQTEKESANEQERKRNRGETELLEISEQRKHSRAKWNTNSVSMFTDGEDYKMHHDDCYLCILSCTRDIWLNCGDPHAWITSLFSADWCMLAAIVWRQINDTLYDFLEF